jgi:hypothetical protein
MWQFRSHSSCTRRRQTKGSKFSIWCCWAVFVMSVIATSSRGAFLGLLALEPIAGSIHPRKIMSLLLGICLAGLVLNRCPTGILGSHQFSITEDKTMEEGTAGQRDVHLGHRVGNVPDNPIFGSGRAISLGRSVSIWEGAHGKLSHWLAVRRIHSTLHCCQNSDLSE